MFMEISGVNAELESMGRIAKRSDIFMQIQGGIGKDRAKRAKRGEQYDLERAMQERLDLSNQAELLARDEYKSQIRSLEKSNAAKAISGLLAGATFGLVRGKSNAAEIKAATAELNKRIDAHKKLNNAIKDEYQLQLKNLRIQKEHAAKVERMNDLRSRREAFIEMGMTEKQKKEKMRIEMDALIKRGMLTEQQRDLALKSLNNKKLSDATALEIRSPLVSVAGLSTGGVIDKQDTTNQLLQEQNRILRELGNNIRMN
jgi:hypothetical protein